MRAVLVVNPTATTTTARTRDVLVSALSHDLKVEVAETHGRGDGARLAAHARQDGAELVVVLGGDGTVNEVVNGLLAAGPSVHVPRLALVPGGSTNVLARALGLPRDSVEATGLILQALRAQRERHVGLGTANGRWFTFCAGLGFDAEVVRVVEQRRSAGRRASSGLYVRSAVRHFVTDVGGRRHPAITLERPGEAPEPGLSLGIVANTAPWTYLKGRPVNPLPQASFDTGLDLLALRRLGTVRVIRHVMQFLDGSARPPRGKDVLHLHDLSEFTLRAERPLMLQVDGDYAGETNTVRFTAVARALRVIV
ncbi:MAG: diacylglycerol/lipid kinase family protein [Actinomycetes bacterium]